MPAAIYARQSIEKADSVSIDAQIERCKAVCTMNGWTYDVYSDVGFSGKNINRPNFERLLTDINSGKITALVSYKLDRVSRSITDFAQLLQLFEKHEVQYISSTEQFDTSSPVGRAMIYIVMVFAQLERETTTQRVTDNYRYRASKGLYMGGNMPLGYTSKKIVIDGRKASILTVDEPAAAIVKEIFSSYLKNFNTYQIAHRLNETGFVTSKNKNYTSNAVLRILRNITYCCNSPQIYEYLNSSGYEVFDRIEEFDGLHGMCCYFKSHERNKATPIQNQLVAAGKHEPIIAAQDWIAVQKKINNVKDSPHSPKPSSRSWLAGLIKCAECGHSYGLKFTHKSNNEYAYYFCRGRADRGNSSCCNSLWISAGELEPLIESLLRSYAKKLLASCRDKKDTPAIETTQSTKLKRELIDCRSQIKNLMDNISKGNEVINRHLTEYITELDVRCKSLEAEINRYEAKKNTAKSAALERDYLLKISASMPELFTSAEIDEKCRIARAFIKQITIDQKGEINIEWLI